MDLDKLPHFGSAASAPLNRASTDSHSLGRLSTAVARAERLEGVQRPRSSKAGDWRLVFPHSDEGPVPSYVEEIQDVKQLFTRKLHS